MSTLVKPFTFSAGATIRASEHNSCFNTLFNDFNGNIVNANFSATASISDTQLATIATSSKVDFSALTTTNQAIGDLMFYSGTNLWTRFARGTANQSLKCQHDSQTVLLLHCDGTDGSTAFTDSSLSAKTVTVNGNAQIDTAQSVFGGASGLFDGTGDYLSLADSVDWDFGTGDFTIDLRVRFNSVATTQYLVYDTGGWQFFWNTTDGLSFYTTTTRSFSWTPSVNIWYHIEMIRTSDVLKVFVDGVQIGSNITDTANLTGGTTLYIGDDGLGSGPFNGWMDEIRISKGIARHTANFTPETQAYQPSLIWVT